MPITDWPLAERPRERLLLKGSAALSDAELLAIFLRVGIKGKSAVDLARELIAHFGSLAALFAASEEELSKISGMGVAKYAQLQAVIEMARRALAETMQKAPLFNAPERVKDYLRLSLGSLPHEVLFALWVNAQNELIASEEIARGTLTESRIYPREVVKKALFHNAHGVILAHNHPSGNNKASEADLVITRALKAALELIEVHLLDHFIVCQHQEPFSFAEAGILP